MPDNKHTRRLAAEIAAWPRHSGSIWHGQPVTEVALVDERRINNVNIPEARRKAIATTRPIACNSPFISGVADFGEASRGTLRINRLQITLNNNRVAKLLAAAARMRALSALEIKPSNLKNRIN